MELKANELRINNLLYDNLGRIIKVSEIREEHIIFYLSNNSKIKHTINSFKPIQLTEEWLLKFGFKKDIIVDLYRLHNQFGSIIYYPSTSVEKAKINFMLTGACFMNNTIINVHQLQNLYFALTNEELEIKM